MPRPRDSIRIETGLGSDVSRSIVVFGSYDDACKPTLKAIRDSLHSQYPVFLVDELAEVDSHPDPEVRASRKSKHYARAAGLAVFCFFGRPCLNPVAEPIKNMSTGSELDARLALKPALGRTLVLLEDGCILGAVVSGEVKGNALLLTGRWTTDAQAVDYARRLAYSWDEGPL